ncbi:hypothetical protein R3P38DRAFT_3219176 [Favolaschia claudopus]|uniref:Uncharacterized protein n=1 Tax=Favolaschia claudopus TaxID=2862362 RepID=A0AAW0A3R6_9AGAR
MHMLASSFFRRIRSAVIIVSPLLFILLTTPVRRTTAILLPRPSRVYDATAEPMSTPPRPLPPHVTVLRASHSQARSPPLQDDDTDLGPRRPPPSRHPSHRVLCRGVRRSGIARCRASKPRKLSAGAYARGEERKRT